ncbi:MAG: hypothetical protein JJ863_13700 [Deltaproteobacteria bacterium]|nr:hypothetical protein [Deltaproteobacteria bacterium]
MVWILAGFMVLSIGVAVWALSGGPGPATVARAGDGSSRTDERGHRGQRAWSDPAERTSHWGSGPADAGTAATDPQVAAYERSWQRFGDAGPGARAPDFSPVTHIGVLNSVEGDTPVEEGARCEVRLLPVLSSLFNCVVRVACDDVVLYPDQDQQAGYAPCDVSDGIALRATDDGVTTEDGDPTVDVDVLGRRVRVHDDGPGVAPFSADIGLIRLM